MQRFSLASRFLGASTFVNNLFLYTVGAWNQPKNGLKGKLKKAFLHFFGQIFGIFDDFSKWSTLKAQ